MVIQMIDDTTFYDVEELQLGATLASFYASRVGDGERRFYTVPLNSIIYIEQEKKP